MEQINMIELYKRLNQSARPVQLVKYIFRVQGASLKRLDFKAAGKELGVDKKVIHRECDKLAALDIIIYENNALKLNPRIIKVI